MRLTSWFRLARHYIWLAPVLLGIVFVAAGIYMVSEGNSAKNEVRDAIVAENIITTEDARIPNVQINSAATAKAQAAIIATGVMVDAALTASGTLAAEGIVCGVVNMHTIKPIDVEMVLRLARTARILVTLEEHVLAGGLGSAVAEVLVDRLETRLPVLKRIGLPDAFPTEYGSQETMMETFGLGAAHIADAVRAAVRSLAAA
ncbi:MAG: hypothetical protein IH957_09590 [Chloroflexi bacterium]|nr:hypothetical protein [Chloroflexota bacterium]